MDSNESKKFAGFIAKLTNAANRAMKKKENQKKTKKHRKSNRIISFQVNQTDRNFQSLRILE